MSTDTIQIKPMNRGSGDFEPDRKGGKSKSLTSIKLTIPYDNYNNNKTSDKNYDKK